MRDELAELLLARTMEWKTEQVSRERPDLQAFASIKYDEYQQFAPGMKFIESLACWIGQFADPNEREAAYNFIKRRLIFISAAELRHLVAITFPDYIRPQLIRQAAGDLGIDDLQVKKAAASQEYRERRRRTLFLGLSDGAHTDILRRECGNELTNDQVVPVYQVARDRAKSLLSDLDADLGTEGQRFVNLVLLDDFTASGRSYFRKEDSGFDGKIHRILKSLNDPKSDLAGLVDRASLSIFVVLYVATERARKGIQRALEEWKSTTGATVPIEVIAIQEIPTNVQVDDGKDSEFFALLDKYFDQRIIDKHYKKGKHDRPYLGFDECALPLVLSHNTPNNSLPILWFDLPEDPERLQGLFPRISRHREGWP